MDLKDRAANYARQNKSGTPTPAQRKRMLKKERRPIARQIREQEAKVSRLRGAAKNSAQKTLNRLQQLMP